MLPVLKAAGQGEIRVSDIVDQIADSFSLTDDERSALLPSARQTIISNRIHWAKTYLMQAGLLESTRRAHFTITNRGREVLAQNPARVDKEYLTRFHEFVEFLDRRNVGDEDHGKVQLSSEGPTSDKTPDEIVRSAASEQEQVLRKDLLDRILASSPAFFEQVVIALLIGMGYGGSLEDAGRKLGKSGDGGVDGVIDQDALGLDSVYVQAKRYSPNNPVGAGTIRDFFGSLDRFRATKGLIITTSTFTRDAVETASHLSKRMVLIDGDQLARLMVRYNVGCRIDETIYLKKLDEEFFGN
jgi:restriction system protein